VNVDSPPSGVSIGDAGQLEVPLQDLHELDRDAEDLVDASLSGRLEPVGEIGSEVFAKLELGRRPILGYVRR
jgi:hypothetical protein